MRRGIFQRLAKEFANPEAREEYLKQHPQADPKNHTVKRQEEAPKEEDTGGFDKKTLKDLPSKPKQKAKSLDALIEQGRKTQQLQVEWLNQGKGIDKELGATTVRGDKKGDFKESLKEALAKPGPVVVIGPFKGDSESGKARVQEKIEGKYDGDHNRITDLVRASIAVDSPDDLPGLIKTLEKSGLKLAAPPDDRFRNPTDAGYRDMNLAVEYPNGHVGELQIHLKSILQVKEKAHKLYEDVRGLAERAKKDGTDVLTPEQQKKIEDANLEMRRIYDEAWDKAKNSKPPEKKASAMPTRTAAGRKYYIWDYAPAYWDGLQFPKIVTTRRGPVTVYDLYTFFTEAREVTKQQFESVLKALGIKMDRKAMVRAAALLPKGSAERRELLAQLQKGAAPSDPIELDVKDTQETIKDIMNSPTGTPLMRQGVQVGIAVEGTGHAMKKGSFVVLTAFEIGGKLPGMKVRLDLNDLKALQALL